MSLVANKYVEAKAGPVGTLWSVGSLKESVVVDKSANLKARLGVTSKLLQDENKILAIENPVDFIKARSVKVNAWFEKGGAVEVFYESIYNDYLNLGFTEEQADYNASKGANMLYQQKLNIADAANPGAYDLSFGTVGLQHDQQVATANMADGNIIKRYKEIKAMNKK